MCDPSQQAEDNRAGRGISRNHPVAARILRRWRVLTGGKAVRDVDRRALVACSGGADSVALAAVLAMVEPKPIIAHVIHDIRDVQIANADRDAVKLLAESIGCRFMQRAISIKHMAGNLEHNARVGRYEALCEMAKEEGIEFIVTGHHGDDQLETVLMHLIRGTGVRGMGGMSPIRDMDGVSIVRPMLDVSREEIESLCNDAGLSWQHDLTNDDVGYLRNRIRHAVLPVLRDIEPEIVGRASGLARSCQEASQLIEQVVRTGIANDAMRNDDRWLWSREELRGQAPAALAELMFVYISDVLGGVRADSVSRQSIEQVVRAIKSADTDPRVHRVGPIVVYVQARTVDISVAGSSASD